MVLGIPKGSSASAIRSAYARLALEHHPDKLQQQQQQQQQQHLAGATIDGELDSRRLSSSTSSSSILEIQAAWEALRDDPLLTTGSSAIPTSPLSIKRRSAAIAEVVTLEDFVYNQLRNDYTHQCRCGGESILLSRDIEDVAKGAKIITLQCPSCSLSYKLENAK